MCLVRSGHDLESGPLDEYPVLSECLVPPQSRTSISPAPDQTCTEALLIILQ